MLSIPPKVQTQFEKRLRDKAIPKKTHGLYKKWLRYYLDFCRKYDFPEAQGESLPPFLRKLKEKRQTKAQQEQAAHAIALYHEILDGKGLKGQTTMIYKHTIKTLTIKEAKGPLDFIYMQNNSNPASHRLQR